MTVWRLILKEILYRKLSFGMGVLSVVVAAGCLVSQLGALRLHDARTERIIAEKEAETKEKMRRMADDYRKIMKKLGFNLLILPKSQNLGDLYAESRVSGYMPEKYVERLAESRIMSVRHLLPLLEQRVRWIEQNRTVILIGTRGEVPLAHRKAKEPMLTLVPPGSMVVGHEIHRGLRLNVGDKVKLLGKEFAVSKCNPERGTKDDATLWINLAEAQDLLGMENQISAIMALECFCSDVDLARIRRDVAGILPDTQVVELASKVVVRAEARARAAETAREAIEAERINRSRLRREREAFAGMLIPLVTMASIVWIGVLAFINARERRFEVGILRALGLRSRDIFFLFLSKAGLIGFLGVCIGYVPAFIMLALLGEESVDIIAFAAFFDLKIFVLLLVAAPVLSGLASFMPAMIAAQQDPAVVLRDT